MKQSSAVDFDTFNYTTQELLNILNLSNPTEQDIIETTTKHINKATSERRPQVAAFFKNVKVRLLHELDKQSEEETEEEETEEEEPEEEKPEEEEKEQKNVKKWLNGQYLVQKNKAEAKKATDRSGKLQYLKVNDSIVSKQEKLGVGEVYSVPVVQGTMNPNLKNTVMRIVNIDTQYRQNLYPNSENHLGPASPTNFSFDLTESLTNVVSIKLNSIQIPYTWYSVDVSTGTCLLLYKANTSTTYIPCVLSPGNYTPTTLETHLKEKFVSAAANLNIRYDTQSGKMTILNSNSVDYDILFFASSVTNINIQNKTPEISDIISASKINSNIGWMMGFRETSYTIKASSTITSESVTDTYGPKYFILVVDDFNQNHLNKGMVTLATRDQTLNMPSYFNHDLNFVFNTNPRVKKQPGINRIPAYIQNTPRQLTQAQLHTINSVIEQRNAAVTDRHTSPTTTNVLAVIPLKTFSMSTGQPYVEFGSSLQTNERIYFGPVNIERMKVQLIDDKGNLVNMHGVDWSFTLTTTHLYEY